MYHHRVMLLQLHLMHNHNQKPQSILKLYVPPPARAVKKDCQEGLLQKYLAGCILCRVHDQHSRIVALSAFILFTSRAKTSKAWCVGHGGFLSDQKWYSTASTKARSKHLLVWLSPGADPKKSNLCPKSTCFAATKRKQPA